MAEEFDILTLFSSSKPLKILAPMVRYSKLPFRLLCRKYGVDICYTPMIIAESFNLSERARDSEMKTNEMDRPLVVQFGAKDPIHFGKAAEKIYTSKLADAVDLNLLQCGCPQRWAIADGIGSGLLSKPHLIKEMIVKAKEFTGNKLRVSIKIRIDNDLQNTLQLVKLAEDFGVDWITVHGRTKSEKSSLPVHLDAIKFVKDNSKVPIVANGDVFSQFDFDNTIQSTGCDGAMIARGMLENPAMFSSVSPLECAQSYLKLALEYPLHFALHYHHMIYMLAHHLSFADKKYFRNIASLTGFVSFFRERGWWPIDCGSPMPLKSHDKVTPFDIFSFAE